MPTDRSLPSIGDHLAVPSQCTAHGDGLQQAIARKGSRFTIEARDSSGNQMTQGGENFLVTIHGASVVRPRVTDKEDGSYVCDYKTAASGSYTVSIMLHGASLSGSPWTLEVLMPRPDAAQSSVKGDALTRAAARETMAFECGFVDALGHPTHAEEIDVYVVQVADGEADDDNLEGLLDSGVEAMSRRWAREWAFVRLSEERGVRLESLKEQADLEAQKLRLEEQRKVEEARQQAEEEAAAAEELRKAQEEAAAAVRGKGSKGKGAAELLPPVAPLRDEALAPAPDEAAIAEELAADAGAPVEEPVATLDPPTYCPVAIRIVGGPKPLIVRLHSDLDSAQTGVIAPGSHLQVVETRRAEDGSLRAYVLLESEQMVKVSQGQG